MERRDSTQAEPGEEVLADAPFWEHHGSRLRPRLPAGAQGSPRWKTPLPLGLRGVHGDRDGRRPRTPDSDRRPSSPESRAVVRVVQREEGWSHYSSTQSARQSAAGLVSGRNERAVNRTLRDLKTAGQLDAVPAALVELCKSLASAVDDEPSNAALFREYRAALDDLREAAEGVPDHDAANFLISIQTPRRGRASMGDSADS